MFIKYRERGLSVIPIRDEKGSKGKAPFIDGWQRWCEELPTEKECEIWDKKYKRYGLCCGPASGVIGLDIDTDDKTVIDICPLSPVIKRGRRGETRFFRYNKDIFSCKIAGIIDVLSNGKQTVIPPTIHPDTDQPYIWLTPDTLENFNITDLPELSLKDLEDLRSKLDLKYVSSISNSNDVDLKGGPWTNDDPSRKCPHGSQDRLKRIVNAMIARGASPDECARELVRFDTENHFPTPYFLDDTRPDYRGDPIVGAINFYHGNLMTFHNRSIRETGKSITPVIPGSEILEIDLKDPDLEKFKSKEYPEPTGLIKDLQDLIIEFSERHMPNIALGGSISLMSAICSNRYRFEQCWTNNYILNLAPTGTGKSYPQRIISKILDEMLCNSILGFGNYQSSSAFNKNLIGKRERFDVIDEISSLFAQLKNGGLWQTSITEEMCKVWSCSSTKYRASEYADKEDTSTCFNPCITILGSSTIDGIKPHISKMMVTKGLIPRFLIFKDDGYGPKSKDRLNESLLDSVVARVDQILKVEKRHAKVQEDLIGGPIYNPFDLGCGGPVFNEIKNDFFYRIESEESLLMKDMLTRGKEHVMKLATIHAAGNFRTIENADLLWAKSTFEVCLHNAKDFIEETAVDTEWEKDVQSMLNLFKKHVFVTKSLIGNRIERLQPQRTDIILKHLENSEKVVRCLKKTKTRETQGWSLNTK